MNSLLIGESPLKNWKAFGALLIFQLITSQYSAQYIVDFATSKVYAIMLLGLDKGKPNEYSIQ